MSRTVPMDKTLSDEDRAYLRSTGAVGAAREAQLDQMFPPDPEALRAFNEAEVLRYAAMHDRTGNTDRLATALDENEALRKRIAELEASAAGGGQTPPPVDYSTKEWTKAALEAEVDRVNAEDPDAKLAKGTKEEMATALTAYFAE